MGGHRSAGIDLLRILGIVAVIAGHVWTDSTVVNKLTYSWHVPLFFFLSGYFWTGGRTFRSELGSRWRSLLVPYISWLLIISAVWIPLMVSSGQFEPLHDIARLLAGGAYLVQPYSAFWFITALFGAAMLMRALQALPDILIWLIAILALALTYVVPEYVARVPLAFGVAFPALIFMLIGAGAARTIRQRIPIGFGLLAVGILLAAVTEPFNIKHADFGTPVLSVLAAAAICAGLTILARRLDDALPGPYARAIRYLASCGTGVILSHALVIALLHGEVDPSLEFVLAVVAPWVVMAALRRTRSSSLLLGVPQTVQIRPQIKI